MCEPPVEVTAALSHAILEDGPAPTAARVKAALGSAVLRALATADGSVGLLLSGGVDSALLLALVRRVHPGIATLTVGGDEGHPDLLAARRLAAEWDLPNHHEWVPREIDRVGAFWTVGQRPHYYPGDAAVLLACQFAAAHGVKTLLATDGIDELVGGYWWHAHESERFSSQLAAFEHFWSAVWPEHLDPLIASACDCGQRVLFPYLDERLVSLLVRLPLEVRAPRGRLKQWWKDLAARYVPDWVIARPKRGFVDALA